MSKYRFVFKGVAGYATLMKYFYSVSKFNESDVAKFRLEVITFYAKYGLTATQEAYKVGRSSLFAWKKIYKDSLGNLLSLIPKSTKPHMTRRMITDPKVLDFIKNLRESNGRIGKEKVKILTNAYCHQENLPAISSSKVGRIIKRNNWFYYRTGRVYHNPGSGFSQRKVNRIRSRVAKEFRSGNAGELLQIDSIVRFDLGLKRYILTSIDLYSRFSFAFSYKNLSSAVALDFYQKLEILAPFKVKAVKTDNGLEFLGEFDRYLQKKGVTHFFSYPRTPKSNAFIERFNRTIQEEFVDANVGDLKNIKIFNQKLVNYLLYYNTVRPHQTLGYLTPMAFMLERDLKSNMSWTSTLDV